MAEMMEDGPDFRISRQRERELDKLSRGMVRFLRHDPSVAQDPAGWVPLPSLLENLRWTAALHEVQWIVDNNNKVGGHSAVGRAAQDGSYPHTLRHGWCAPAKESMGHRLFGSGPGRRHGRGTQVLPVQQRRPAHRGTAADQVRHTGGATRGVEVNLSQLKTS
ncbi:unnamed protein product [Ostreobium quekettii]|uniref:Uncharacterized protein n=1 Tax=Ostreobium quekettii TaxID=121088 RepID=A0A8S1J7E0_9CHLO|nr:unnamed protein product [Ostreobium quekettii]